LAGTTALAGDVYLSIDADAGADGIPDTLPDDIKAVISNGEEQTLQTCYTVPDGFVAYVTNWCSAATASAAGNTIDFRLRKWSSAATTGRVQMLWALTAGTSLCHEFMPPARYPARTMIEVTADADGAAGTTPAFATFDIVLGLE
jgi:hypothetical protein